MQIGHKILCMYPSYKLKQDYIYSIEGIKIHARCNDLGITYLNKCATCTKKASEIYLFNEYYSCRFIVLD